MNNEVKQELIDRLNPLLVRSAEAINARDIDNARRLSIEALALVMSYSKKLTPEELKAALNNEVANELADRLGLKP